MPRMESFSFSSVFRYVLAGVIVLLLTSQLLLTWGSSSEDSGSSLPQPHHRASQRSSGTGTGSDSTVRIGGRRGRPGAVQIAGFHLIFRQPVARDLFLRFENVSQQSLKGNAPIKLGARDFFLVYHSKTSSAEVDRVLNRLNLERENVSNLENPYIRFRPIHLAGPKRAPEDISITQLYPHVHSGDVEELNSVCPMSPLHDMRSAAARSECRSRYGIFLPQKWTVCESLKLQRSFSELMALITVGLSAQDPQRAKGENGMENGHQNVPSVGFGSWKQWKKGYPPPHCECFKRKLREQGSFIAVWNDVLLKDLVLTHRGIFGPLRALVGSTIGASVSMPRLYAIPLASSCGDFQSSGNTTFISSEFSSFYATRRASCGCGDTSMPFASAKDEVFPMPGSTQFIIKNDTALLTLLGKAMGLMAAAAIAYYPPYCDFCPFSTEKEDPFRCFSYVLERAFAVLLYKGLTTSPLIHFGKPYGTNLSSCPQPARLELRSHKTNCRDITGTDGVTTCDSGVMNLDPEDIDFSWKAAVQIANHYESQQELPVHLQLDSFRFLETQYSAVFQYDIEQSICTGNSVEYKQVDPAIDMSGHSPSVNHRFRDRTLEQYCNRLGSGPAQLRQLFPGEHIPGIVHLSSNTPNAYWSDFFQLVPDAMRTAPIIIEPRNIHPLFLFVGKGDREMVHVCATTPPAPVLSPIFNRTPWVIDIHCAAHRAATLFAGNNIVLLAVGESKTGIVVSARARFSADFTPNIHSIQVQLSSKESIALHVSEQYGDCVRNSKGAVFFRVVVTVEDRELSSSELRPASIHFQCTSNPSEKETLLVTKDVAAAATNSTAVGPLEPIQVDGAVVVGCQKNNQKFYNQASAAGIFVRRFAVSVDRV